MGGAEAAGAPLASNLLDLGMSRDGRRLLAQGWHFLGKVGWRSHRGKQCEGSSKN